MAGIFPRIARFIVWVARPNMVDAAFASWIWPLLWHPLVPFATLMYVILWHVGGLSGWDWVWVVLAGLLDPRPLERRGSESTPGTRRPGLATP